MWLSIEELCTPEQCMSFGLSRQVCPLAEVTHHGTQHVMTSQNPTKWESVLRTLSTFAFPNTPAALAS